MATTKIYKVLGCGDITQTPSQKSQGGFITKRTIRLQEHGGASRNDQPDRISNAIIATMMGNMAQCNFTTGRLVVATIRSNIREYQGTWYQDNIVLDISNLS